MFTTVYWVPCDRGRLGVMPRPRGGDWLGDEVRELRKQEVDVLASLLTTQEAEELDLHREAAACAAAGIRFVNIPVPDRGIPGSASAFRETAQVLAAELTSGATVVAHCRQGIGRASLLAAGVLACGGIPVPEAFERVAAARGRPVPDTPEQRVWVEEQRWTASGVAS
jgi:protein-tyrosine phosphatase